MIIPETFSDRLLHLHYCAGGSYSVIKALYNCDPELKAVYLMSGQEFIKLFPKSQKRAAVIFKAMAQVRADYLKQELDNLQITVISVFDDTYPPLLRQIYDPPWLLYCRGNTGIFNNCRSLSVVGTRHPSSIVKKEMEKILVPLVQKGIPLISGMAIGIDSIVHETAVHHKGLTAAVLGYGLNHIYPSKQVLLKKQLEENQLVISEYPPYIKPERWRFPERNRIISGISPFTLVTEAKEKSGSLITADCALSQNRDVFAFPGRISDPVSLGTNRLIQQGAKLILHAEDILNEYY